MKRKEPLTKYGKIKQQKKNNFSEEIAKTVKQDKSPPPENTPECVLKT